MVTFIYIGKPTYGLTTKTIKAPVTGGWATFSNITPNITPIQTSDEISIAYFRNNIKAFIEQV